MSKVFGASQRPRILLEQIPAELHDEFKRRFPTVKAVDHRSDVEEAEYDVLVTTFTAWTAADHLFAIVFSDPIHSRVPIDESQRPPNRFQMSWAGASKAQEYRIPVDCPPDLATFLRDRVIPILRKKSVNKVIHQGSDVPSVITPFITTATGAVLAGRFPRLTGVECWAFPFEAVEHAAECTSIAIDLWRQQDLTRFPYPVEDWTKESRWRTLPEEDAAAELTELRSTRERELARFAQEEGNLEGKLELARTNADSDERLLLTAQGEPLVRAVQRCLEEFGFGVRYMDDEWPEGDRREDLRNSLPLHAAWTNITEVRGYARGAEVNDFLRIGRFRMRYLQDEGSLPSCSWYIVNEYINQDPGSRPYAMRSNNKEVETFGDDGGLVIGSVTLFDMLMDFRNRKVSQQEVQRLLREGRDRLSYDRRS